MARLSKLRPAGVCTARMMASIRSLGFAEVARAQQVLAFENRGLAF